EGRVPSPPQFLPSLDVRFYDRFPPPPRAVLASPVLSPMHDGTEKKRLKTADREVERLPPGPASTQIPVRSFAICRKRERRAIRSSAPGHTRPLSFREPTQQASGTDWWPLRRGRAIRPAQTCPPPSAP